MKYKVLQIISLFLFAGIMAFAQSGTISGTVKDAETAEPLGARILLLKNGTPINGANADFDDGSFALPGVAAGDYSLKLTYFEYNTLTIEKISVGTGENIELDLKMWPNVEKRDSATVVITEKIDKGQEFSVLNIQRKSLNVMDGISSQQLTRTGDNDAASAIGRVTGISVEGGKYVYVRGLGDRYSQTTLNGSDLPSLDPNRNTVQMDMFPTNLIDNIVVYKTFTPDLPGSFTGGLIKITTKDFPDQFTFKYSGSVGINDQASLRDDFLTYETGKLDWLGMDDGTRSIPQVIRENGVPNISFSNTADAQALDQASKSFATSMTPKVGSSAVNTNHSFSIGNQILLKAKNEGGFQPRVGYIASLSYRRADNFYDNGVSARWKLTSQVGQAEDLNELLYFTETTASKEVLWGGLANVSYQPWEHTKLSFNYMHNQSGQSGARYFNGRLPDDDPNLIFETRVLSYMERALDVFQLKGNHTLRSLNKTEIEWIASRTWSEQDEPDLRFFSNDYTLNNGIPTYDLQPALYNQPARYFRNMQEVNTDLKLNLVTPFRQWSGLEGKFKYGGAFTNKVRAFTENRYEFESQSMTQQYNGNPDDFFAEENMGIVEVQEPASGQFLYLYGNVVNDATELRNNYNGRQNISAAYFMTELPLARKLKTILGARYEGTDIFIASKDLSVSKGILENHDILPSINLIYNPKDRMNLRASFTRTLARPTFRELAPFASFEFVRDFVLIGNPELERTVIDNFDLRWEIFPTAREIISVSTFYKHFTNPIERVINPQAQNIELNYRNVPEARLLGVELEVRKSLDFLPGHLRFLRIGGNASIVRSALDIDKNELALIRALNPQAKSTRPMFGMSPYTVNAELSYLNDTLGLNASLNFNVFGERISVVSVGGTPDVYEKPRPRLDFSLSKSFGAKIRLTARARNLLNPEYKRTHTFNDTEYIYQTYTVGRTYSLGFTYMIR